MEESVRVPLVVCAPGGKSGVASPRLVELVDIFPTLVEFCGLPTATNCEGRGFAQLLDTPDMPWKPAASAVVLRGKSELGRRIRTEKYSYIEWPDGSKQLYDHDDDPQEYVNLAGNPKVADVEKDLRRTLRGKAPAAEPAYEPPTPR